MASGDKVKAGDFTAAVWFDEGTDSAISTVTYDTTAGSPTLPVCGIAFTAPTSGRVKVSWKGRLECKTNNGKAYLSLQVATGGTAGSGTVLSAGTDDNALETTQSATATTTPAETRMNAGNWRVINGLTPGTTYNACVVHRCQTSATATVYARGVLVEPLS